MVIRKPLPKRQLQQMPIKNELKKLPDNNETRPLRWRKFVSQRRARIRA